MKGDFQNYRVVWEIDLKATSPRDAAEQALEIQRDPESIATVFDVTGCDDLITHAIDLDEDDE